MKEFTRSAIDRAVAAVEKGRKAGQNGRPELFNKEEKETIFGVLKIECESGTSYNAAQMRKLMNTVINDRKKDDFDEEDEEVNISKAYPYQYTKRNPDLKVSHPRNVDIQRLSASNQQTLLPFFTLPQNLHDQHHYSNSLIFNIDESSLRLSDSFSSLVFHPSDMPAGFSKTPMNMPNATLVVASAADGYSLKSVVLWTCHKLPDELRLVLSSQLDVWGDNEGWMTETLFLKYAEEVLLPGITQRRETLKKSDERCLLLLDSHSSRAQPDLWKKFADSSTDVVTFVPHTTHIAQPLDRGVFAVFKKTINANYEAPSSSSVVLRREALADVLPQALQTSLLPSTIKSSFAKSGELSHQWHEVLAKLPKEPSVTLKKRTKRFDYFGKLITDEEFLIEWKKEKDERKESKNEEKDNEEIEKALFEDEKPKKRKFNPLKIFNDDFSDDEKKERNTRKFVKRKLVDYILDLCDKWQILSSSDTGDRQKNFF
ncbi:putative DDE superfamily endonuclease [Monocercomonoides exilis]|uniref:putative DDE superfamily endonuclease n=1 Tax=Monocercomonoides exilis TaxID=2049356 RepID=UPI00355938BC|nr:putative DDE superfamily endonuclease [Monocercomonoides exilis]|eukprot:MONOS_687.1-p1 / transcript=MONOS_687.1 / gene=MONOS_687 / organism=Monocercomonoides_exilis_PA203 / gene_product=unspecified product / transcript_product=unspecified product / location=Mono_scaffold00011:177479-178987(-) / protein_length=485 / sequence_SO=supercontig / SO=protein_coding / is_pseudo=false